MQQANPSRSNRGYTSRGGQRAPNFSNGRGGHQVLQLGQQRVQMPQLGVRPRFQGQAPNFPNRQGRGAPEFQSGRGRGGANFQCRRNGRGHRGYPMGRAMDPGRMLDNRHFGPMPPMAGPHQPPFTATMPPMQPTYDISRTPYNNTPRGYHQNPIPAPVTPIESPAQVAHDENVKYISDEWKQVDAEFHGNASTQIQYYQEKVPNSQLAGFQAFDLEQFASSRSIKPQ